MGPSVKVRGASPLRAAPPARAGGATRRGAPSRRATGHAGVDSVRRGRLVLGRRPARVGAPGRRDAGGRRAALGAAARRREPSEPEERAPERDGAAERERGLARARAALEAPERREDGGVLRIERQHAAPGLDGLRRLAGAQRGLGRRREAGGQAGRQGGFVGVRIGEERAQLALDVGEPGLGEVLAQIGREAVDGGVAIVGPPGERARDEAREAVGDAPVERARIGELALADPPQHLVRVLARERQAARRRAGTA